MLILNLLSPKEGCFGECPPKNKSKHFFSDFHQKVIPKGTVEGVEHSLSPKYPLLLLLQGPKFGVMNSDETNCKLSSVEVPLQSVGGKVCVDLHFENW